MRNHLIRKCVWRQVLIEIRYAWNSFGCFAFFLLRAEKPMNDCLWQNSFHFLSIRISFDGFMVSRNGWQWFDCWNRRQTGRLGSFVPSDSDDWSDGQTIGFAFLRGSNKRPPECQWISRNDRNVKSPYWNLKCTACDVTKRSKRFLTAFSNFFPWHFARPVFVFLEDCEPFRNGFVASIWKPFMCVPSMRTWIDSCVGR